MKQVKNLCTPAYVYLVMSVIGLVLMFGQNVGNTNTYCVGQYECQVPNTTAVFIGKALYVMFWTFILHALCKAGYKNVSWFIVLLPFILLAIMIGMLMISGGVVSINKLTIDELKLLEEKQLTRQLNEELGEPLGAALEELGAPLKIE